MERKRVLLPYAKYMRSLITPINLDNVITLIDELNVDGVDISMYPTIEEAEKAIYRLINGRVKIYKDIHEDQYKLMTNVDFICSSFIGEKYHLSKYTESDSPLLAPQKVMD